MTTAAISMTHPRTAPGLGISGWLLWTADQLRADPLMRYLLVATCLIGVAGCMPLKPRAAAPAMPEAQSSITREQAAAELVTARAFIVTSDYAKARGHVTPVIADAERWGWLDVESDAHFLLGELYAVARILQIADGPDEVHHMAIARRESQRYQQPVPV